MLVNIYLYNKYMIILARKYVHGCVFRRACRCLCRPVRGHALGRFVGRAHSGLVDARNTAALAAHMVNGGFRFVRGTRGLSADGRMLGAKRREARNDVKT